MRKLTATLCLTLAVLLGIVGLSASADFQKGLDAARSGDYVSPFSPFSSNRIGWL